ncbi:MFS-type transporter SLC18B1-like [Corticium candelabrum]|uniref:MFS-type transporter SLC18B1-like n=1 Tax=Corticium candelabrum TaxID=121492 RepID=UPI002E275C9B|nr:MFS-type transporter SLC18B1-like [Corticium candelabrum]
MDEESSLVSTEFSEGSTHTDVDASSSSGSDESRPLLLRQYITAALLVIVTSVSYICIYLPISFYPQVAARMKGSKADTEVGLMVGSFQLSAFVASIFVGMHVNKLGVRFLVISGTFILGGTTLLFGFVDSVDTWAPFISLSILIRFIMGFGEAAFNAAAFTLVLSMFPSHTATAWAVLELPEALGFMAGEPIGGFLYDSHGFLFPFVIFGGVLLIFIPVLLFFLSSIQSLIEEDDSDNDQATMWSLIKTMPMPVVFVCLNVFCSYAPLYFIDTTFAVYLSDTFGWSATKIGLVTLILAGSYIISSILMGRLVDATKPRVIMIIGLLLEGCSLMLIGPSFVFQFLPRPWLVYLAMVMCGLALAMVDVSASPDIINSAVSMGYKQDMSLNGVVSGLILAAVFLSGALTAPLAGWLTATFGFRHASSFFAFINFLLVIVTAVISIVEVALSRRHCTVSSDSEC